MLGNHFSFITTILIFLNFINHSNRFFFLKFSLGAGIWIINLVFVGRTIDFKFDNSQIPIVGIKYWDIQAGHVSETEGSINKGTGETHRQTDSVSHRQTDTQGSSSTTATSSYDGLVSTWRRPVSSQVLNISYFNKYIYQFLSVNS